MYGPALAQATAWLLQTLRSFTILQVAGPEQNGGHAPPASPGQKADRYN